MHTSAGAKGSQYLRGGGSVARDSTLGPMTTRREFLAPAAGVARAPVQPLAVPVRIDVDTKARWTWKQIGGFWSGLWPEAVGDFARCGIRLESTTGTGQVERPPFRQPIISGLVPRAVNLVVTDRIP